MEDILLDGWSCAKVNLTEGTWGEDTVSQNPSDLRGTNNVGVLGTIESSPGSS